ncbi:hypothetical protein MTX36_17665 [Rhodococcus sp. ARC_M6]|nr:hypothetical protein [Rhodococcus sp. ARC_M6]MCJ0905242.1 hypothetical protein [Rhodococcus sp. ARC_M6]
MFAIDKFDSIDSIPGPVTRTLWPGVSFVFLAAGVDDEKRMFRIGHGLLVGQENVASIRSHDVE